MADPLSIAAGVSGLVASANRVSKALVFIRNVREAERVYHELVREADELDAILRAIERIGLDKFDEAEAELINDLSERSRLNVTPLLEHLAAAKPSSDNKRWQIWRRRKKRVLSPAVISGLKAELKHATVVARILLANAERNRTLATTSSSVDINLPSSNIVQELPSTTPQNISSRTPVLYITLKRPRTCVLIFMMFSAFVLLSCFLGIYFTLDKAYGYSMGDAFTLAGWVVAVGAFISSGVLAQHYPRCNCWERSTESDEDRVELQRLFELHE